MKKKKIKKNAKAITHYQQTEDQPDSEQQILQKNSPSFISKLFDHFGSAVLDLSPSNLLSTSRLLTADGRVKNREILGSV